jgi:DNA-binding response OmpR family regulator
LNNYKVISAKNGRLGFELAKKHRPDLVLCDMMMPDTDGRKFLQLAKNNSDVKTIPLIFFSAGSLAPDVKKKLITEADHYLQKPFEENDLLDAIANVLHKASR